MTHATTQMLPAQRLSFFRLYRPLMIATLLVFGITIGLTLFTHHFMDEFMGSFFIVFAIPKLFNIEGFSEAFSRYDLIAKRSTNYAKAYPWIEIFTGLAYITNYPIHYGLFNKAINLLVIMLTSLGILGIVTSLRHGKNISCACLGAKFAFPLSNVAIFENSLMLMMACYMLIHHASAVM